MRLRTLVEKAEAEHIAQQELVSQRRCYLAVDKELFIKDRASHTLLPGHHVAATAEGSAAIPAAVTDQKAAAKAMTEAKFNLAKDNELLARIRARKAEKEAEIGVDAVCKKARDATRIYISMVESGTARFEALARTGS